MPLSNPMRLSNPKRREGFSLIEVMVAMVILTVGLFAVINLQVIAVRGNTFARARTDAQKIAMGVSDEIRTRALGWVSSNTINRAWTDVFLNMPLSDSPTGAGANLDLLDLRSVMRYQEQDIAPGNAVGAAQLIDVSASTVPGGGAMYRVHYIAHEVPPLVPRPGDIPNLVRMTVFVSWDSKDHGRQDYLWGADWSLYFRRHMVSVTQFLSKRRI